jgi:hypothetical protein
MEAVGPDDLWMQYFSRDVVSGSILVGVEKVC